jgi:hypothetical protein
MRFCSVLLTQSLSEPIENTASSTRIVVFTAPLISDESYSIVACVFVAAGMCLTSRCLAMGLHVAKLWRIDALLSGDSVNSSRC